MANAKREMSVFLDRQTVRRKRDWLKSLRQVERALISVSIVLAGLACLYGLYLMVFFGPTFSIHKIVIDGKWHYLTPKGLALQSGVNEGDNLFWINVEKVHELLREDPWVLATAVRRKLPDTLWIYVEEREPTAILSNNEDLYFVDNEGAVFKKVEVGDEKNFPVLTGAVLKGDEITGVDTRARLVTMIELIKCFSNSKFGAQREVSEVHFDYIEGYSIFTKREPLQVLFGHAAFSERMSELDDMSEGILAHPGRIQYMMVNEPNRIIVKYQTS